MRRTANLLAENPLLGRERPEIHSPPYRFWVMKQKLIVLYDPTVAPIVILRVFDARRDPHRALQP